MFFQMFHTLTFWNNPVYERKPSKIPAYIQPQLTSPKSQVSKSDLDLTQREQSLLETLETLCGSTSTSNKFVRDRIKGSFVSDSVFNLSQKTLL